MGNIAGLRDALAPLGILDPVLDANAGIVYGTLPTGVRGPINSIAGAALLDPESTGLAKAEMYGAGFGFNLGYVFNLSETQRISLSYRSRSTIHLKGKLDWQLENIRTKTPEQDALLFDGMSFSEYLARNYRPDTTAELGLIIPAKLDAGYFIKASQKLDVMANLQLNQTSAVQRQCLRFGDQPGGPTGTIHQGDQCVDLNWRDSYTASVGANYHLNDQLTLRTGIQYDQTPVPSTRYRSYANPDNNRLMLALGANYQHDKQTNIDFAYAYMQVEDGKADYVVPCRVTYFSGSSPDANNCTDSGGVFRANYTNVHSHIVGIQLNKKL